ncbi:MerR family transcriptional regulator [Algoriphagus aestuarii]|nr:MerR family transcriptional regulator [Algoriphagus aestuarii]
MDVIRLGGDDFLIALNSYFRSEGGNRTSEFLNTPKLPISDIAQSRVLNHWEKEGVINDKRDGGKGWRRYSPMEVIWIHIIMEMRKFNFSLSQLKKLKGELEGFSHLFEYSEMPELELYVRYTLSKPKEFYLIVYPDGSAMVAFKSEIEDLKSLGQLKNHISIDLLQILRKVFPKVSLELEFKLDWKLSESEEALIKDIRSGIFNKIELEVREGEVKRYEAEEIIRDKVLFREIALDYPYQRIESVIKDNKTVAIKRTVSKKFI